MNHPAPDLLKLLDWSQRLARGERCAEWEVWSRSSPDAAWQWPRLALAAEMPDAGGLFADDQPELAAEDIAAWLDGGLSETEIAAAEQRCWQSPMQLAEVASAVRFRHPATLLAAPSDDLTRRLLELGPQSAKWRINGSAEPLPVASPLPPPIEERAEWPAVLPALTRPRKTADLPLWLLVTAAAMVLAVVSGAIGWFLAINVPRENTPRPVAASPDRTPPPPPSPQPAPP